MRQSVAPTGGLLRRVPSVLLARPQTDPVPFGKKCHTPLALRGAAQPFNLLMPHRGSGGRTGQRLLALKLAIVFLALNPVLSRVPTERIPRQLVPQARVSRSGGSDVESPGDSALERADAC